MNKTLLFNSIYYYVHFYLFSFHLKGKERKRSIHWFTPQVPTIAKGYTKSNQEPEIPLESHFGLPCFSDPGTWVIIICFLLKCALAGNRRETAQLYSNQALWYRKQASQVRTNHGTKPQSLTLLFCNANLTNSGKMNNDR